MKVGSNRRGYISECTLVYAVNSETTIVLHVAFGATM